MGRERLIGGCEEDRVYDAGQKNKLWHSLHGKPSLKLKYYIIELELLSPNPFSNSATRVQLVLRLHGWPSGDMD